ncbi:MAG: hypothetical protein HYX43_19850 [Burkholderiales bacterium]|nr:hypothetical protein [Burkholderiales bacterium]
MQIAIVGAPGTGTDLLLHDLPAALQAANLPQTCTLSPAPSLMEAVVRDLELGNASLYPDALVLHRAFDLTLLSGLETIATDPHTQALDARMRQTLDQDGLAYAVVYGDGPQRIRCAVQAIAHRQQAARSLATGQPRNGSSLSVMAV